MFGNDCLRCGTGLIGKQEKYCSETCRKRASRTRWRKKANKTKRKRILEHRAIKKARREELINESLRKK